jgi:transcriptional regulator with XRE-family HTH domain
VSDSPAPGYQPELAVHNVVRAGRERLGLSQRSLGKRANLSSAYVGQLESGSLKPSLNAFARLACELRLTPGEVFLVVKNAALQHREHVDV